MHRPIWRVRVAERSMEPALRHGDWLLVLRTRRIRPGQIVVARHPDRPDMLLVKRAAGRVDGGWWLTSDNPAAGVVDSARFGAVPVPFDRGPRAGPLLATKIKTFIPNEAAVAPHPDKRTTQPDGGAVLGTR